jgi:hypothetical protein
VKARALIDSLIATKQQPNVIGRDGKAHGKFKFPPNWKIKHQLKGVPGKMQSQPADSR